MPTDARQRKQARDRKRKQRARAKEKKQLEEAFLLMDWHDRVPVPGNPSRWFRFLVARGFMPPENSWDKLAAGMGAFIEEQISHGEAETNLRWDLGLFKQRKVEQSPIPDSKEPGEMFTHEDLQGMSVRKQT